MIVLHLRLSLDQRWLPAIFNDLRAIHLAPSRDCSNLTRPNKSFLCVCINVALFYVSAHTLESFSRYLTLTALLKVCSREQKSIHKYHLREIQHFFYLRMNYNLYFSSFGRIPFNPRTIFYIEGRSVHVGVCRISTQFFIITFTKMIAI